MMLKMREFLINKRNNNSLITQIDTNFSALLLTRILKNSVY